MDQTRVKWRWNDVIATKGQFAPIGHCHFVRNIFAGQFRQGVGTRNFHFIVNCACVNVQCTTEQIGEPQNVVHLVRVITPTRRNNRIGAHFVCFFWGDFGIWVSHRKNHGVVRHGFHHVLCHSPFGRHAKKDIGTLHRLVQCAQICFDCMGRFPLVHTFGTALVNDAFRVAHDTIFVACAHVFQQFKTRDPGRTRAV